MNVKKVEVVYRAVLRDGTPWTGCRYVSPELSIEELKDLIGNSIGGEVEEVRRLNNV